LNFRQLTRSNPFCYFTMAAPPSYADIGKSAKDLFGKGFDHGSHKVEFKSKTECGTKFTTSLNNNNDSGSCAGSIEGEYKIPDRGVTVKHKWSNDNVLATDLTVEDEFIKGLKLTLDAAVKPPKEYKSALLKIGYKQEYLNANCDVNLSAGPIVNAAAVVGYKGWLAGYQTSFDSAKSKITKNNFTAGYVGADYALTTTVNDGDVFAGSFSHKVSSSLEAGAQIALTTSTNTVTVGLAAKYLIDDSSSLRAKINDIGQLGLSYQQDLRKGVALNLSTLIEGSALNEGHHKVGLGLTLEA